MHTGDKVYITRTGKTFHLKDDDCGVSSSIMKGRKKAFEVTEEEARAKGLTLCRTCAKEYAEDQRERGRLPNGQAVGCLVFIVPIVGVIAILAAS